MSGPAGRPFETPHAALRWIDDNGAILKDNLIPADQEKFEWALDALWNYVLLGVNPVVEVAAETSHEPLEEVDRIAEWRNKN